MTRTVYYAAISCIVLVTIMKVSKGGVVGLSFGGNVLRTGSKSLLPWEWHDECFEPWNE